MRHHYSDIRDRIAESPTWFDEVGVPRYGAFSPGRLGNIYAREAALAEISCQSCGRLFTVAMDNRYAGKGRGLCDEIRLGRLCYGDPPNTGCCGDASMTSVMHGVLEYWSFDHETHFQWHRDPAFEGPVTEVYEPVDTVSEVLAAIESGETAIRVVCTSTDNRYDLAGRVAAAIAAKGRVLIAFPPNLSISTGKMLAGLVPDDTLGTVQQARAITLAPFDRLSEVPPDMMDTIIILAGAAPSERVSPRVREAEEQSWQQTMNWFESAAAGKVQIEFALAGRRRVIARPTAVVDSWKMRPRNASPEDD